VGLGGSAVGACAPHSPGEHGAGNMYYIRGLFLLLMLVVPPLECGHEALGTLASCQDTHVLCICRLSLGIAIDISPCSWRKFDSSNQDIGGYWGLRL